MDKVISFIMAAVFSLLSFFNIPFEASDLQPVPQNELTVTAEDIQLFRNVFNAETAWIASLQLENGAIPMTATQNGELNMNPYFADFAALALLDKPEVYATQVKAYLDWHFAHLNTTQTDYNGVDGTIYDYTITVENGKIVKETSKQSYDSTDSYAATFLTLLNKYYNKTADQEYIFSKRSDIQRIVNAMFSTMHNNLTLAKPDYEVKYLMDNCEVYEGLIASAELFENAICINDSSYTDTLTKCKIAAEDMQSTFEKTLWNYFKGYYKVATHKTGSNAITFSWDEYYPSATAQLFPIICGVIAPNTERAVSLYNKFCDKYVWEEFEIPESFCWGSNVYAAAIMGDKDRVVSYMKNYIVKYGNHAYPLYNADSAKVAMAANILLEKAQNN